MFKVRMKLSDLFSKKKQMSNKQTHDIEGHTYIIEQDVL